MPSPLKFDVFGTIMVVELSAEGWQLFTASTQGKRSRVDDIVIPHFIQEHELAQFLDDMFHEMATRQRPCVTRIPT